MLLFIYNQIILNLVVLVRPLLIFFGKSKVAEALRHQSKALSELEDKLQKNPVQGPCLWVHVSSAGEFLQARPVMDHIKAQRPDVFIALSFMSTSAVAFVENYLGANISFFAPLDTAENMQAVLKLLKPRVLVVVRSDIWPNMISETQKAGAKTILISAHLRESSGRNANTWLRNFFAELYRQIDAIFVVGPADKERFLQACPEHLGIRVVGDTRFDSVLIRQAEFKSRPLSQPTQVLLQAKSLTDFILVAGSAWPDDEDILVPAWKKIKTQHSKAWLVMVPHEPQSNYLNGLEAKLQVNNLSFQRFSNFKTGAQLPDVLIMDRVGLLADLYRLGDAAYVGAGTGGIHNTMEPAAWGLPVCFRPEYQNAPEAVQLVEAKVFHVVATPAQASALFEAWIQNRSSAQALGKKGREFLEKSSGATSACCAEILRDLGNSGNSSHE